MPTSESSAQARAREQGITAVLGRLLALRPQIARLEGKTARPGRGPGSAAPEAPARELAGRYPPPAIRDRPAAQPPPPQPADAAAQAGDAWLDDLTAAVNKELRSPALAAAGLQATREQAREAYQGQEAWQQRGNTQAQAARIAHTLITGRPATLPGGAIGAEIELEVLLERTDEGRLDVQDVLARGQYFDVTADRIGNTVYLEIVTRPVYVVPGDEGCADEDRLHRALGYYLEKLSNLTPGTQISELFPEDDGTERRAAGPHPELAGPGSDRRLAPGGRA